MRFLIAALVCLPAVASAETVLGYQIGASGSVAGQVTDNEQLFVAQNQTERPPPTFTGLRSTLTAAGNLSLDVLERLADHAFVLGLGYTQMIPAAVPDEVNAQLQQGPGVFNANANYMLRVVRRGWGFGLGASYAFASNGRVPTEADGTTAAVAQIGNTQPGQDIGEYLISGVSHSAVARGQLQFIGRTWDVDAQANYSYIDNGIFALGQGAPGAAPDPGLGNATGQFLQSNAHLIGLDLQERALFDRRHSIDARAQANLTLPEFTTTPTDDNGTPLEGFQGVRALNEALLLSGNLAYAFVFNQSRRLGARLSTNVSWRTPANGTGSPLLDEPRVGASQCPPRSAGAVDTNRCGEFVDPLQSDTAIWRGELFYADRLPWRLGFNVSAGVAQASMFQAPPGAQGAQDMTLEGLFINPVEFETVTSNIEPIFQVGLARDFEPVNVALTAGRTVGPGALGAAAVVTWLANLTFTGQFRIDMIRALRMNVGFAFNWTDGVGSELFTFEGPTAAAFDNRSFGANANLSLPLFNESGVAVDGSLAYTFRYADLNPENDPRIALIVSEPFVEHNVFLVLSLSYGRGSLQQRNQAFDPAALDSFSANPMTGSPLMSATLMNQGASMLTATDGPAPGVPPEPNSQAAIEAQLERSQRQEQIETEALKRVNAVQSSGDVIAAEAAAKEAEEDEREERKDKRTRTFSEWPMDSLALPEGGDAPDPDPEPETSP